MNIGYIFGKALRGEEITNEEINFAESTTSSSVVEEAVQANAVLKAIGNDEQRALAYKRLAQVCEAGLSTDKGHATAALLSILEHFSQNEFRGNRCFIPFIYQAAKNPFVGARINAMRVLRQLARLGDEHAMRLLTEGLQDPHEYVSRTAKASVEMLGK